MKNFKNYCLDIADSPRTLSIGGKIGTFEAKLVVKNTPKAVANRRRRPRIPHAEQVAITQLDRKRNRSPPSPPLMRARNIVELGTQQLTKFY